MSITALFAELGAPLVNMRWSWGAVSEDLGRVYLRVWEDEIEDDDDERYVNPLGWGDRAPPGRRERERHVELIRQGAEPYCILCRAHDPKASPRRILSFNKTPIWCELVDRNGRDYLRFLSNRQER